MVSRSRPLLWLQRNKHRETTEVNAAGIKAILQEGHSYSGLVDNHKQSPRLLTERWGVMFGENLILGSVGVKEQKVIEVADAVSQRADGEVFGRVGHKVPNHPLTWETSSTNTSSS